MRHYQQFYTSNSAWLTRPVVDFIAANDNGTIVDPFAGQGDLLKVFPRHLTIGYDIDPALGWNVNDSLGSIPANDNSALCITNPPYLSKSMASRKGVTAAHPYFHANPGHDNLYKIAIQRCLDNFANVIAIIPESFLHCGSLRARLKLVDVCERNLFEGTTQPVLTACWSREEVSDFTVYRNGKLVSGWGTLEALIPRTQAECAGIAMNHAEGNLALKSFDDIRFYRPESTMPVGGRHHCRIMVRGVEIDAGFIEAANVEVRRLREGTQDLVLTPLYGNNRHGVRRRRLPLRMARNLLAGVVGNLRNKVGS